MHYCIVDNESQKKLVCSNCATISGAKIGASQKILKNPHLSARNYRLRLDVIDHGIITSYQKNSENKWIEMWDYKKNMEKTI